jgi:hypothetical protein
VTGVQTCALPISRKSSRASKPVEHYSDIQSKEDMITKKKAIINKYGEIEIYNTRMKPPKRDGHGDLIFEDYPNFRPNLTPQQVLQAGSFGGTYYRPITSSITNITYSSDDVLKESVLPEWLEGLNVKKMVTSSKYDNSVNKYKVACGGDLHMWESSGWIVQIDPYGWFQWYCRFYQGRRSSDDERQIARGLGVIGPKGRWRRNLINKILAKHPKDLEKGLADWSISPVIRQLLLHWGYDLTLRDLGRSS